MLTSKKDVIGLACAGETEAGNRCKKPAHYRDYGTEQYFCWEHSPQYVKDYNNLNFEEVIAFRALGPTEDMAKDMVRLKEHMRRFKNADG